MILFLLNLVWAATPTPSIAPVVAPVAADTREAILSASQTLQVDDKDKAAHSLIAAAESLGGWFSSLTDDAVVLRVPAAQLEALLAQAATLGTVVEKNYGRVDSSEELRTLRTRLSSRQEMLQRYLAVLNDANRDATVTLGREIARVISDIEGIQGRIRLLEEQSAFAQVSFSFRFRDRAAPTSDGASAFAWLNQLNLSDMLYDFQYGKGGGHSPQVHFPAIKGFAAFKKTSHFAALSPDDVKLRARVFRNKPKADLAFWREAMRVRMIEAGYTVLAEGDIQAQGGPGSLLTLSAPSGDKDYTYMIALFVDGGRLVVVEALGETRTFEPWKDALLTGISGMSF